jgi:hypothetical protein
MEIRNAEPASIVLRLKTYVRDSSFNGVYARLLLRTFDGFIMASRNPILGVRIKSSGSM